MIRLEVPLLEVRARSADEAVAAMYSCGLRKREQMRAGAAPRASHQDVRVKVAEVFRFGLHV